MTSPVTMQGATPAPEILPREPASARIDQPAGSLPIGRLNTMRIGYLVMGVGLAVVKWPLFFRDGGVGSLPVFEGVVAALLTAMSLLAFLGLKYPQRMAPLLALESLWKVLWLAAAGVPHLVAGDMDAQMSSVLSSVSVVVIIVAVTPWGYVWQRYVTGPGEPWRRQVPDRTAR